MPSGPLPDGIEPCAELREYVSREFGADSAAGAVYALSEVLGELQDPVLVALLAEGWCRQAARFAELLAGMDLPRLVDAEVGGTLLLDALHGSLFRSAVNLGRTSPLIALEHFLEFDGATAVDVDVSGTELPELSSRVLDRRGGANARVLDVRSRRENEDILSARRSRR